MQSLRAEVGRIVAPQRQSQIIRQRSNDSSPLPAPPRQTVGQGRVPGDVGLRQFALLSGGHGTEIIVSQIKSSVEVQRSCPVTLLRDPFLQHLRRPSPLRKDQLGLKHTKRIRLLRRSCASQESHLPQMAASMYHTSRTDHGLRVPVDAHLHPLSPPTYPSFKPGMFQGSVTTLASTTSLLYRRTPH